MKVVNALVKGIKRAAALFAGICIMGSMQILPVCADAVWEPSDDFYWNHAGECEYVGTDYQTNGKEGYVNLYKEPNDKKTIGIIKNDKRFYVGFSWTDKKQKEWAVIDLWNFEPQEGEKLTEEIKQAWVLMSDLERLYNEADFRADYEETFAEYTDEMKGYEIQNAIYLWEYPGSAIRKGRIEGVYEPGDEPAYEHLYTDPDGRRWTYIGYYYGHKGWVCIDEPENKELAAGDFSAETDEQFKEPEQSTVLKNDDVLPSMQNREDTIKIAAGFVLGVIAVTAVFIYILFGKKKKK